MLVESLAVPSSGSNNQGAIRGDEQSSSPSPISLDILRDKRVLVVGGSGRVGGSCVTQLTKRGALVTVGGTSADNFASSKARWKTLFPDLAIDRVSFCELSRERTESVQSILKSANDKLAQYDLVVHTAGPFQGKVKATNGVLEACAQAKIPYVDVCDDYCTAKAAQSKYSAKAQENGVPCIISTGCWPGVSSLMALQLIDKIREADPQVDIDDLKVDFSFFTAGSGGAGVTLLVATFLILSEPALMIQNGRRRTVPPMQDYSSVSFGDKVGSRDVAPLNLLETASIADNLGAGNVQALFGTAPNFWNALLGLMAKLPSDLLANEPIMRNLSIFSIPIVRIVDAFAGATNAMRCEVSSTRDPTLSAMALYAHENLEPCVGECVTAFASAVLSGRVAPGVWFPEQAVAAGVDAAAVLSAASVGAHTIEVGSSPRVALETEQVWGSRTKQQDRSPALTIAR
jgi:saccharopine dehydrogenase-like NADP-dependent oxidoreductase